MSGEPAKNVTMRFPPDLIASLDAEVKAHNDKPGIPINRTELVIQKLRDATAPKARKR